MKGISRLLENVLGNLVASGVISLAVGAWALLKDLPGPVIAILMLSAFVLIMIGTDELKKRIDRERRRRVRLLTAMRRAGTRLLNAPVASEADVERFKADLESWDKETLGRLGKAKAAVSDIAWFRDLTSFAVVGGGLGGYNPEHAHLRNVLDEKIRRLDKICRRIEER